MVIDGVPLLVYGQSDPHPDGSLDLSTMIHGEEAALKVAKRLKIEPRLRKHPSHRFLVRWAPEKESYEVEEPVTLKLEIRNVGDVPFTFRVGGQQRGPRDNQFRFLCYRSGGESKAVPDEGDPLNFGGIGSYQTLKPGETFTKSIALDKWFRFTKPDGYRVTALYQLELHDHNEAQGIGARIWDDFAVGDCVVRVVPKEK
jgi:hypothetical protein